MITTSPSINWKRSVSFHQKLFHLTQVKDCENPLKSFIPISRKDDNGYVFVIASINKSYYIGVINLNGLESLSEEIIKELNERRLAFDYKPSFDIERIKTIEGKSIKELQFFDYDC
ncbi:hypothetical protein ACTFIY_011209 [Dictyostelium cf. discoideum]